MLKTYYVLLSKFVFSIFLFSSSDSEESLYLVGFLTSLLVGERSELDALILLYLILFNTKLNGTENFHILKKLFIILSTIFKLHI